MGRETYYLSNGDSIKRDGKSFEIVYFDKEAGVPTSSHPITLEKAREIVTQDPGANCQGRTFED